MNRKLILGAVAGVAAIGLAVGGTTYAAYSDFGQVTTFDAAIRGKTDQFALRFRKPR